MSNTNELDQLGLFGARAPEVDVTTHAEADSRCDMARLFCALLHVSTVPMLAL